MNFKKAEDFYLALGSGKVGAQPVVNKVLQRLKTEQAAEEEAVPLKAPRAKHADRERELRHQRPRRRRRARAAREVLHAGARATRSSATSRLGKGITIHRGDCPNVKALARNPERFTPVSWDGGASQSFRVQIAVDSWDRPRLLEDVARTFAEHGANIVSYGGTVEDQMARNWYIGRGRRREGAARPADGAAQHRGRLRRLSRYAVLTFTSDPRDHPSNERGTSFQG